MTDEKDLKGVMRPMKTTLRSRLGTNIVYYGWYKASRAFFVCFYYYFFPLAVIILSLGIPVLL
jgi:hypothetical protein